MAKRQSVWFPVSQESLVLAGGTFIVNLTNQMITLAGLGSLRGYTLTRTIGELSIRPLAPSGTGILKYAAGILMVATSDSPAVAAVNPLNTMPQWAWWTGGSVGLDGSEVAVAVFGATTKYVPVESRAQRKHDSQEARLLWVFLNDSTVSLTVNFNLRLLFKLP